VSLDQSNRSSTEGRYNRLLIRALRRWGRRR